MDCPKCGAEEHKEADAWLCGSYLETHDCMSGFDSVDQVQVWHTGEDCYKYQIEEKDKRIAELEAKLGRVLAFVEAAWEKGENAIGWDALNLGVSDILADTRTPLAVVEGWVCKDCGRIELLTADFGCRWCDDLVTGPSKFHGSSVVAMPKESEGE